MDEELGERECTCPEIISKHPLCECDRKHFNNFLWATVTVFQVSLAADPFNSLSALPPTPFTPTQTSSHSTKINKFSPFPYSFLYFPHKYSPFVSLLPIFFFATPPTPPSKGRWIKFRVFLVIHVFSSMNSNTEQVNKSLLLSSSPYYFSLLSLSLPLTFTHILTTTTILSLLSSLLIYGWWNNIKFTSLCTLWRCSCLFSFPSYEK